MDKDFDKVSTMKSPIELEPRCIVNQGYMVKSPPTKDVTTRMKKWRLRWFILYDTKMITDIDPSLERKIDLLYYKSKEKVTAGIPKGTISLIGVDVYKHKGGVNGYPYVIDVETDDRLYHLCCTQVFIFNDWFEKIRAHHMTKAECKVQATSSPRHRTSAEHHGVVKRCTAVNENIKEQRMKFVEFNPSHQKDEHIVQTDNSSSWLSMSAMQLNEPQNPIHRKIDSFDLDGFIGPSLGHDTKRISTSVQDFPSTFGGDSLLSPYSSYNCLPLEMGSPNLTMFGSKNVSFEIDI